MTGDPKPAVADVPTTISDEALRKAEEFVEQEEGAANRLVGWAGIVVTLIAGVMTLFHLYAAYDIVPTQPLRYTHVAFVMMLAFLLFPLAARFATASGVGRGGGGGLRRNPHLCHLGRRGLHRPRHARTSSTSFSA